MSSSINEKAALGLGIFMVEHPCATRITAPVLVAGTALVMEAKVILGTIYNLALFALSTLATVLTLGLCDKARENMGKSFVDLLVNAAGVVIVPIATTIAGIPVTLAMMIAPESLGKSMVKQTLRIYD